MKIAMILSGSGHLDGAEIRESVLSLLYLDQHGAEVDIYAPDMFQHDVVNHQTGKPLNTSRNVLHEAARIARGNVQPLALLEVANYDGLVVPGGFGVAKNLSDFATKGADCTVLPEFKQVLIDAVEQKKPIAAICIAPAVIAAALKGVASPTLTIGEDSGAAGAIEACGAKHQNAATNESVSDDVNAIYSCSAYMQEDPIADVAKGIEKTIQGLVDKCKN